MCNLITIKRVIYETIKMLIINLLFVNSTWMYVHVHGCIMYVHVHVHGCMYMYVHVHGCKYTCMYVHVHGCIMYVHVCTYIHVQYVCKY